MIRRFARQVAERFHPDRIILFGSYAYGTPHADSDVDILVVMPCRNQLDHAFKIEATIDNAQALLELDAEYGGFDRYLRSHGGFDQTVADLKRQFRFIGDSGAYHFLYVVGEQVPPYEEWRAAVKKAKSKSAA